MFENTESTILFCLLQSSKFHSRFVQEWKVATKLNVFVNRKLVQTIVSSQNIQNMQEEKAKSF